MAKTNLVCQGRRTVSNIGGARQLQSLNIGVARGGAKYYNPQILRVLEPLSPPSSYAPE